jgi:glutamine amidotransferase PdxT
MIAIVKYNAGNIKSVKNALTRLGYESIITDNAEELKKADKVIFPGVGEASSAMEYLVDRGLDTTLKSLQKPVLGICLGMGWFSLVRSITELLIVLAIYGLLTRWYYAQLAWDGETRCRKCQYILRGISEPRCPECRERI